MTLSLMRPTVIKLDVSAVALEGNCWLNMTLRTCQCVDRLRLG
jgi:hypothetical protein